MSILPAPSKVAVVIGGKDLTHFAAQMAYALGYEIVAAGCMLVTGGRRGTGEQVSRGAAKYCQENDLPVEDYVFAVVPKGNSADFSCCRCLYAGKNKLERGAALMHCAERAFVIGGAVGTLNELMFAAVDCYMAWGTAKIVPVAGTGGMADRILKKGRRFDEPYLNDPTLSRQKAHALVYAKTAYFCPLDDLWGIDIHDAFARSNDPDPVVRRFAYIRHRLGPIAIEMCGEYGDSQ